MGVAKRTFGGQGTSRSVHNGEGNRCAGNLLILRGKMTLATPFVGSCANCIMVRLTLVQPTPCDCSRNRRCTALHHGLASNCIRVVANLLKSRCYSLHPGASHIPPIPKGIVQRAACRPAAAGYRRNAETLDAFRLIRLAAISTAVIADWPERDPLCWATNRLPGVAAACDTEQSLRNDRKASRPSRGSDRSGRETGRGTGEVLPAPIPDRTPANPSAAGIAATCFVCGMISQNPLTACR
jgi:hypothetical protein